jgi:hypothetical protein
MRTRNHRIFQAFIASIFPSIFNFRARVQRNSGVLRSWTVAARLVLPAESPIYRFAFIVYR